jgi:hypothetical protein
LREALEKLGMDSSGKSAAEREENEESEGRYF